MVSGQRQISCHKDKIALRRTMLCFASIVLLGLPGCESVQEFFDMDEGHSGKVSKTSALAKPPEEANATPNIAAVPPFEPKPGGMLGALGVNLQPYLSKDIKDPMERIERLETVVGAIQRDLRILAPSLQELAAVESDMQDLVKKLEKIVENGPTQAHGKPKSLGHQKTHKAGQSSGKNTTSSQPPKNSGGVHVKELRTGIHPGKVRLVLDVSAKTDFSVDIDNSEKLLIVELPASGWKGPIEKNFKKSKLLNSYRVNSFGHNGSILIVQLKKGSSILHKGAIPAAKGKPHRIVIDLSE